MNKYLFLISLLFITFLLVDCNQHDKNVGEQKEDLSKFRVTSELSELMRLMQAHTEGIKDSIILGKPVPSLPNTFQNMYTAIPTDPEIQGDDFNAFIDVYMSANTAFYNSSDSTLRANYNNLIKSCLDCHQKFCPGPIPRIRKLRVEK